MKKKKNYKAPQLIKYGSVKQFTQVLTGTHGMDLGMSPASRTMTCLTPATVIEEHRMLLVDEGCQQKFRDAIFATVKPGDVVLDLGTGTGIHAFFACQAGAAKVYAVDAEGIIERAKQAAEDNGFGDKITFVYGMSDEIELPEKVDVLITNIGYLGILKYLPKARERFLKDGGRMIPSQMYNTFVPAFVPSSYNEKVDFWKKRHQGFDFSAFHELAIHQPIYRDFSKEDFFSTPASLPSLDLLTNSLEKMSWKHSFKANKSGVINCLVGWYTFKLSENVSLSTEPPLSLVPGLWVQHMLPLEQPITVSGGEEIEVEISMRQTPGLSDPVWSWSVRAREIKTSQSTFKGMTFIPDLKI